MKKAICLILSVLVLISLIGISCAEPVVYGQWQLGSYVDTGRMYVLNRYAFEGKFKNTATKSSKAYMNIIIDKEMIALRLYEYKFDTPVKNNTSSQIEYTILIGSNGTIYETDGLMVPNADFIAVKYPAKFQALLTAGASDFSIYIKNKRNTATEYLFQSFNFDGLNEALTALEKSTPCIDSIKLAFLEPPAGKTSNPPNVIVAEENPHYRIDDAQWVDKDLNELKAPFTFEPGKTYYLFAYIEADKDYDFPDLADSDKLQVELLATTAKVIKKASYNFSGSTQSAVGVKIQFTIPAESGKTGILPGDVNGDGVVDGRDVIRFMKYLALDTDPETGKLYEVNQNNADVDGSGKVDEKDLLRIVKYLGGEKVTLQQGKVSMR